MTVYKTIYVKNDRPVGGHPPGSYEALAAIERVRIKQNPAEATRTAPAWGLEAQEPQPMPVKKPRVCRDCGVSIKHLTTSTIRCFTCRNARNAKNAADKEAKVDRLNERKRVTLTVYDAQCAHCGKPIERIRSNQKYCSKSCGARGNYAIRSQRANGYQEEAVAS